MDPRDASPGGNPGEEEQHEAKLAWTERDLAAAVQHGLQREAFQRVRSRIAAIKSARTFADYYAIQVDLLKDILWAQEFKSRARRNGIRTARSKAPSREAESGSWDLEHRIASRVERQLRSVGDALAWRLLGCRRFAFWTLSQNSNPGSMYGKAGLDAEVRQVEQLWARGEFALLTDLTQSIRIGDLVVFSQQGPQLVEVKTSPGRRNSTQRRRIRSALAVLNREAPLLVSGEAHEHFEATAQMKTQLAHLRKALEAAKDGGFASGVVRKGWAVMGVSLLNLPTGADEKAVLAHQQDLMARAGLDAVQHVLQSMWSWLTWDVVDPFVGAAPFGAYPFEPDLCAALTCGYSMFRTFVSSDLIDDALIAHGFRTIWHLQGAHDVTNPTDRVVSISRRAGDSMRGIDIQGSAFNPILYEFLEPDRYAAALRELFDWSLAHFPRQSPTPGELHRQLGKGTLALSNERAIWFKNR